jgi:hypothetical protein
MEGNMGRLPPSLETLESRFHACLARHDLGLSYTELVSDYSTRFQVSPRAARYHIRRLRLGIQRRTTRRVGMFTGPRGVRYGNLDNPGFIEAREQAERPLADTPLVTLGLPGDFSDSEVRSEWTHCPVSNKIVRTSILTVGVADFMECPECHRVHFLGVNPKRRFRHPAAWELDPLVNSAEYADALTVMLIGDPETYGTQHSSLPRIRRGGHYVGLMFRSSWDEDPTKHFAEETKKVKLDRQMLFARARVDRSVRR